MSDLTFWGLALLIGVVLFVIGKKIFSAPQEEPNGDLKSIAEDIRNTFNEREHREEEERKARRASQLHSVDIKLKETLVGLEESLKEAVLSGKDSVDFHLYASVHKGYILPSCEDIRGLDSYDKLKKVCAVMDMPVALSFENVKIPADSEHVFTLVDASAYVLTVKILSDKNL